MSSLLVAFASGCGGDLQLGKLLGLADGQESSVEYEIVPAADQVEFTQVADCSDIAPAAQPAGPVTPRLWSPTTAYYQNGAVEHSPLYVNGPFAELGDDDAKFQTWSIQDVFALAASPAVFVANVVATPVMAIITPALGKSIQSQFYFNTYEPFILLYLSGNNW